MTPYDAATDVLADCFKVSNNQLTVFHNYFSQTAKPENENEFTELLRSFLFSITHNNLTNIYAKADPQTAKIIRRINTEIKKHNFRTTIVLSDKYVHRKPVDLNTEYYAGSEEITVIVSNIIYTRKTFGDFFTGIFDAIENSDVSLKAIAFNDLINLSRIFFLRKYAITEKYEETTAAINYDLVFHNINLRFKNSLNKYFVKKDFSENERIRMYNIIDDYIDNILNGGVKIPPAELTRKHFGIDGFGKFKNKVEYCLQQLTAEMAKELKESEID